MRTIEMEQKIETKVIPLESRQRRFRRYDELLEASTEYLEETAEKLLRTAVNLAAGGSWAAWDEEQPESTEIDLDPAALLYCPDDRVRGITLIWQQIMNFLWDEEVGSNP